MVSIPRFVLLVQNCTIYQTQSSYEATSWRNLKPHRHFFSPFFASEGAAIPRSSLAALVRALAYLIFMYTLPEASLVLSV